MIPTAKDSSFVDGSPSIAIANLSCTFGSHTALNAINLNIDSGEMVALIGPSGAGKSTLLRCVAGLIPGDGTSGPVRVNGRVVQSRGRVSSEVRSLRAGMGFVFQQFNLVNRLSLLTNVLTGHLARMPLYRRLSGIFTNDEKAAAMRALKSVGLERNALQRADTLSGGQQQRAAVARAMVQQAKIILADEPIASLDPESARIVMSKLRELNLSFGATVIVSVHQIDQAKRYCDRMIGLRDGQLCCDCKAKELTDQHVEHLYTRDAA